MSRFLILFGFVFATLFSAVAHAQNSAYPSRSIKFIVPITPGGSNDVVARVIAQ